MTTDFQGGLAEWFGRLATDAGEPVKQPWEWQVEFARDLDARDTRMKLSAETALLTRGLARERRVLLATPARGQSRHRRR